MIRNKEFTIYKTKKMYKAHFHHSTTATTTTTR